MNGITCSCLVALGVASAAFGQDGGSVSAAGEARFTLTLRRAPGDAETTVVASNAVSRSHFAEGAWAVVDYRFAKGSPVSRVVVKAREEGADCRFRLSVSVADGWFLEKRSFPELRVPLRGRNGCDRACFAGNPDGDYRLQVGGGAVGHSNGSSAGAFAATWDDDEGVYFGIEDGRPAVREFSIVRRAGSDEPSFSETVSGWKTGEVVADYDIVRRQVRRSGEPLCWTDFCDIYRAWEEGQPWGARTLESRADVPDWLRGGAAMVRFSRQWLEDPGRLEDYLKGWRKAFGDQPVLAAIWGWEKLGTWWGPDYFPCHPNDDVFGKCIAIMKRYGFHPFAWPSGYNWSETIGDLGGGRYRWDGRESWVKKALPHLAVESDGTYSREAFWLEDGSQVTLCGGDPWSREWFVGVVRGLAERGVEAIQIDQTGGGQLRACWNAAHGHEPGLGDWCVPGLRKLIEEVRRVPGVVAVGNEFRCERLNDLVVLQDLRELEWDSDVFAGAFGYLHHDKVVTFQSNPRRGDLWQLAFMASVGELPLHEPQFADFLPDRPALRNGDFEEMTDNSRGPEGWDRRPFYGQYLKGVDFSRPTWGVDGWSHSGWLGICGVYETNDVHSGRRALRFDHRKENWIDRDQPVQLSQTVEGLESGRYTVSVWVKSDNDLPAFRIGTRKGELASVRLPASDAWTRLELTAESDGELQILFVIPLGSNVLLDDLALTHDGRSVRVSGEDVYRGFFRRWVSLHCGAAAKWLARGRRIRAPRVETKQVTIGTRTLPAVCSAAYRASDGSEALVLANGTKERQPVAFVWKGRKRELALAPADLLVVTP